MHFIEEKQATNTTFRCPAVRCLLPAADLTEDKQQYYNIHSVFRVLTLQKSVCDKDQSAEAKEVITVYYKIHNKPSNSARGQKLRLFMLRSESYVTVNAVSYEVKAVCQYWPYEFLHFHCFTYTSNFHFNFLSSYTHVHS
jgi:hypothetical protein